jgi:hypothetical protein
MSCDSKIDKKGKELLLRPAFFVNVLDWTKKRMAAPAQDEGPAPIAADRYHSEKTDRIEPATVEHLDDAEDEPKLSKPATTFDVLTHTIHLQDDTTLSAITVRSMIIGKSTPKP